MIEEILDYEEEAKERKYFDRSLKWMIGYVFCWIASEYFLSISEAKNLFNDNYADIAEVFNLGFLFCSINSITWLYVSCKIEEVNPSSKKFFLVITLFVFVYVLIYFVLQLLGLYYWFTS